MSADPLGQHSRVFGQRRIRPLSHQGSQHFRIRRPAQQGLAAAAAQRGAAALPRLPQPVVHRANRDLEPLGQHTLAALAPLMRRQHALSQVYRQGHGSDPSKATNNALPNQPFRSPRNPL